MARQRASEAQLDRNNGLKNQLLEETAQVTALMKKGIEKQFRTAAIPGERIRGQPAGGHPEAGSRNDEAGREAIRPPELAVAAILAELGARRPERHGRDGSTRRRAHEP